MKDETCGVSIKAKSINKNVVVDVLKYEDYKNVLSDCNWTRTHNHLVHKRTLNYLAKLAK